MAIKGSNTGNAIIALRGHFKMTQEDLARKACITLDELKEIESGKPISANAFEFELIAEAFGLPVKDLTSCAHNQEKYFKEHLNVAA